MGRWLALRFWVIAAFVLGLLGLRLYTLETKKAELKQRIKRLETRNETDDWIAGLPDPHQRLRDDWLRRVESDTAE